jgi:hypothetical protein
MKLSNSYASHRPRWSRIIKGRQSTSEERNTRMNSVRYVGLDVHRDTISVAVLGRGFSRSSMWAAFQIPYRSFS